MDLVEMVVIKENADVLLAVFAVSLCMTRSEMKFHFLPILIPEKDKSRLAIYFLKHSSLFLFNLCKNQLT